MTSVWFHNDYDDVYCKQLITHRLNIYAFLRKWNELTFGEESRNQSESLIDVVHKIQKRSLHN